MFCLTDSQWIAIGSIGTFLLAIAAFITLYFQNKQFKKARRDENERAFKNSSVQLITDFDKQFQDLENLRSETANTITGHGILEKGLIENYNDLKIGLEELYDFFDTLGFFVAENYIKAEVVHQYFHYWFEHYYAFFVMYNVKSVSGYPDTVWINLPKLSNALEKVEIKQLGKESEEITKEDLLEFFQGEA
jgi:hypothetical protein